MSGIPSNKRKGAPNTWPFHTSSWRRAWQENDEKGEPPTYVLEMKWEALKLLAFQKSWDLPLPVLRGYSVCGSLIRLQSAKSQPLRELPIRYASKETWVYYSFQSQVQLKLTKLTPHLTILNSDRGIASIFYYNAHFNQHLLWRFFYHWCRAHDLSFTEDGRTPANQCLCPGATVSALNTYLATVSFCQQCHAELRAEFIVNVRRLMSEGNYVCVCARTYGRPCVE